MATDSTPLYHVIGFLRTGGAFYISKHKASMTNLIPTTQAKAHAWKMFYEDAEDMVQRFHRVQADGHYHQDVLYYHVRKAN